MARRSPDDYSNSSDDRSRDLDRAVLGELAVVAHDGDRTAVHVVTVTAPAR